MDVFTKSYLVAAMWVSVDGNDEPLDTNYDLEDFSLEAIAQATADCEKFQRDNETELANLPGGLKYYLVDDQAGYDFWMTRNGHGVGFWDRPEYYGVENEHNLTRASREFGECTAYVGDDGKIYFM